MSSTANQKPPTILLIAASRGLGLAMAEEFLNKGWNVVGTVRSGSGRTSTALGGPNAPFSVEEAIPKVVNVLLDQRATPCLRYLDREGKTVPW